MFIHHVYQWAGVKFMLADDFFLEEQKSKGEFYYPL